MAQTPYCCCGLVQSSADKPGFPVANDFGHTATIEPDYRCSAGHGLGHYDPECFIYVNRHKQGNRPAKQLILLVIINGSYIDDLIAINVGTNVSFEVLG